MNQRNDKILRIDRSRASVKVPQQSYGTKATNSFIKTIGKGILLLSVSIIFFKASYMGQSNLGAIAKVYFFFSFMWCVISLIKIDSAVRHYRKFKNWEFLTKTEWWIALLSFPSLLAACCIFVYYLSTVPT